MLDRASIENLPGVAEVYLALYEFNRVHVRTRFAQMNANLPFGKFEAVATTEQVLEVALGQGRSI